MKYLAAVVLSLVLVGCSDTEPVQPEPTIQATPEIDIDQLYLDQIREDNLSLEEVSDAQLIDLGNEICAAFDRGASFVDVAQVTVNNGFTPENGGFLIGTAIGAYCPEHEGVIS